MLYTHVALDPFPVGGGITSIELIMAGTPIVTFEDNLSVIRTTPALVRQSNCGKVVRSVDEFAEQAVKINYRCKENAIETSRSSGEKIIADWRKFIVNAYYAISF